MKIFRIFSRLLALELVLAILAGTIGARSSVEGAALTARSAPAEDPIVSKIDAVLAPTFKTGTPGAALLVIKNGKVVVSKGYGMADLELGVPVEPDMSFRIGSLTKQFTAVSILMLEEGGELSVKDPIAKYLPDYPRGTDITIEHLLTHTSGIKDYTSLSEWLPLWRKDMTVPEVIALFKDKPPDFEPGEHWKYSNSGYILLGAILEKASGETYENFVRKHIFEPLGMKHSYYGNETPVLPRRVPGYNRDRDGFTNATYISMTQPFAAGALLSSVEDLAIWNNALMAGKLISKGSLDRAWTPGKLRDGTPITYGYGWTRSTYEGHPLVEHSGGITGFTSHGMLFPNDAAQVILLTNSSVPGRAPEPFALQIVNLLFDIKPKETKPVALGEKELQPLVGVYADWEKNDLTISREGTKAFAQRSGGPKVELIPVSAVEFAIQNAPSRLVFVKNERGEVTKARSVSRNGIPVEYIRTARPLPSERKVAAVDPKTYDSYVGEYVFTADFAFTVTNENGRLMARATGQPKVELFPESETSYFLKVVDAQVEFQVDKDGKATGLVLTQGGQKIPAKKK